MKTGSQRYSINRTSPMHGHKYTKHKMCLTNQHLSHIWSWIHEKVKKNWGWVDRKYCL